MKFYERAAAYARRYLQGMAWQQAVAGVAAAAVLVTGGTLGVMKLTGTGPFGTSCQLEEHEHGDACYTYACLSNLEGVHQYGRDCYNADGKLTCTETAYVIHQHDGSCFDWDGNLVCPLVELEASGLYGVKVIHEHDDYCFDRDGARICMLATTPYTVDGKPLADPEPSNDAEQGDGTDGEQGTEPVDGESGAPGEDGGNVDTPDSEQPGGEQDGQGGEQGEATGEQGTESDGKDGNGESGGKTERPPLVDDGTWDWSWLEQHPVGSPSNPGEFGRPKDVTITSLPGFVMDSDGDGIPDEVDTYDDLTGVHTHIADSVWEHDAYTHWHPCIDDDCSARGDEAAHAWSGPEERNDKLVYSCECGATKAEPAHVDIVDPSSNEDDEGLSFGGTAVPVDEVQVVSGNQVDNQGSNVSGGRTEGAGKDYVPHVHGEDCGENCKLPVVIVHTHTDKCFERILTCQKPEHKHGEDCLVGAVCGKTEHQHGDDCYDEDGNLICKQEEHVHGPECGLAYSLIEVNQDFTYEDANVVIDLHVFGIAGPSSQRLFWEEALANDPDVDPEEFGSDSFLVLLQGWEDEEQSHEVEIEVIKLSDTDPAYRAVMEDKDRDDEYSMLQGLRFRFTYNGEELDMSDCQIRASLTLKDGEAVTQVFEGSEETGEGHDAAEADGETAVDVPELVDGEAVDDGGESAGEPAYEPVPDERPVEPEIEDTVEP